MEKRRYDELPEEDKKIYDNKLKNIAASYFTPYDDKKTELEIGKYCLGLIRAYKLTREGIKRLEEAENIRFNYDAFSDAMMAVYIADLCDIPVEDVAMCSVNSRKISILFHVISIMNKLSDIEYLYEKVDSGDDADFYWAYNDTLENIIKEVTNKE